MKYQTGRCIRTYIHYFITLKAIKTQSLHIHVCHKLFGSQQSDNELRRKLSVKCKHFIEITRE